jgi:hypothetical protein
MATKALDPVDRERWLRVAEQWLDLIPRIGRAPEGRGND